MKISRSKFLKSQAGEQYKKNLSVKQTISKTGIQRTPAAIEAISNGHKKYYQTEEG